MDDSKVEVCELAEATSISIGLVVIIIHKDFCVKKLTAKWVPRGNLQYFKNPQTRRRHNYRLEMLWFLFFGIPVAYCLVTIWKKKKRSTMTINVHYWTD